MHDVQARRARPGTSDATVYSGLTAAECFGEIETNEVVLAHEAEPAPRAVYRREF